jgi:hypothetical protein
MAKSPSKPAPTSKPVVARPKVAKPIAVAKPKPAKKEASAGTVKAPVVAAAKPTKVAKSKAKDRHASVFKETSSKISKLASDILADRIVPTTDQIKAIAASALGQDQTKGQKVKKKKK